MGEVLPHLLASESVQRFREEAMVVVRLSHGNLVGVLDAGREGTQDSGQFDSIILTAWCPVDENTLEY